MGTDSMGLPEGLSTGGVRGEGGNGWSGSEEEETEKKKCLQTCQNKQKPNCQALLIFFHLHNVLCHMHDLKQCFSNCRP